MAHKKGVGSTDNGRDSNAKFLGVKLFGGQYAKAGNIIIRQRGTKFHPGLNVGMGKDHTLFALVNGTVSFKKRRKNRTYVYITPDQESLGEPTTKKSTSAGSTSADNGSKPVAPSIATSAAASAPETAAPDTPAAQTKTESATTPATAASISGEGLTKIEGIGPKIAEVLTAAGYTSYLKLSSASPEDIRKVLDEAEGNFAAHDPATWPRQAGLAALGKWDDLKELQDRLDGGKLV